MHVCMYACMYVCMYICMYVCMYACIVVNSSENEVSTMANFVFNNFFVTDRKNKTLGTKILCTCRHHMDACFFFCIYILNIFKS